MTVAEVLENPAETPETYAERKARRTAEAVNPAPARAPEPTTPEPVRRAPVAKPAPEVAKGASRVICVMGESGSGKTTAMRNLDPRTTFYIDADKKGLSWKGWRKQYSPEKKNFRTSADAKYIRLVLDSLSENAPHIKTIVIDTLNGIMLEDEFKRMKEKGYDKWQDLAASVWDLVEHAHRLRNDLTVIFIAHSQTERDETGYSFTRLKSSGRKLDKICLESKFTTVFLAKAMNGQYFFETKANNSTVKTPLGAFDTDTVENDIVPILAALEDF